MTLHEIARLAWDDVDPDPTFIADLLAQLRSLEVAAAAPGRDRRSWIVAGAIASVVGAGFAAYEVHRVRRRRAA